MDLSAIASHFKDATAGNEFLSGGIWLAAIGILLASLRRLPSQLWALTLRQFSVQAEFSDRNEAFWWIQPWIARHTNLQRTRNLYVSTRRISNTVETVHPDNMDLPPITIAPGLGTHWTRFRGRWLIVTRTRGNDGLTDSFLQSETIHIRVLPTRNNAFITQLCEQARADAYADPPGLVTIRTNNEGWWHHPVKQRARCIDSVVLADGVMEDLLADLDQFLRSEEHALALGIPWRRGYLLHGPPGNGKTCAIQAIAGHLCFPIEVINLGLAKLNDSGLSNLITQIRPRSILLFEDIDAVFEGRSNKSKSDVSFNHLLQTLDGVMSHHGLITFMTTNRPEVLDSALVRYGRVDRKVCIDYPTRNQIQRIVRRFRPRISSPDADVFTALMPERTSMAAVQGILRMADGAPVERLLDLAASLQVEAEPDPAPAATEVPTAG